MMLLLSCMQESVLSSLRSKTLHTDLSTMSADVALVLVHVQVCKSEQLVAKSSA